MSLIKGTDLYPENEHRLRNVAEGNDELVWLPVQSSRKHVGLSCRPVAASCSRNTMVIRHGACPHAV